MVDEFQDISDDRYLFLKHLRGDVSQTKLFCVGDDWQSIYRFAGSNIQLFYKFEEYFGYTDCCVIENTYRFHNPALSISSDFVMQNPYQKKKTIKEIVTAMPAVSRPPFSGLTQTLEIDGAKRNFHIADIPVVSKWIRDNHTYIDFHECGYCHEGNTKMREVVERIVKDVPQDETVLLLGRYNYDVNILGVTRACTHELKDRTEFVVSGHDVVFMSVHASKGLEADHVVLLNCDSGVNGFPALIEDDPVLRYILNDVEDFDCAEERRLFYVALTRAKRHMHILYHVDRPSPFVKELTDTCGQNEFICPMCKEGHVLAIKRGITKKGVSFTTYGCSNSNFGCQYFERVFDNQKPYFERYNSQLKK